MSIFCTARDTIVGVDKLKPTLAGACFAVVVALGFLNPLQRWYALFSGDSFMHVRIGQEILRTGHVPVSDVLSFTHFGAPYVAHEWLFEVLLALLYRAFDIDGLVLFSAVALATLLWLLVKQATGRGARWPGTLLALIPFLFAFAPMYRARPHLITALGFAVGAFVLNGSAWRKRDWRVLLGFAAGLALWTNFHMGSMIFLGILAIEAGTSAVLAACGKSTWDDCRWTTAVLAAASLGSLATPYGIKIPMQVLGFITAPGFREIQEHQPLDFTMPQGIAVLLLAVGLAAYVRINRHRLRVTEVLEVAFLGILTVYSRRNSMLFAIMSFSLTALALSELVQTYTKIRVGKTKTRGPEIRVEVLWIVCTLAFVTSTLLTLKQPISAGQYYGRSVHPVQAVEYIHKHLSEFGDRMYNAYNFGGYLTFALPERKVFIDGRADFYGLEFMEESHGIGLGKPGTLEQLTKWNIDWVIVGSKDVLAYLLQGPVWKQVYRDQVATIFQLNRTASK